MTDRPACWCLFCYTYKGSQAARCQVGRKCIASNCLCEQKRICSTCMCCQERSESKQQQLHRGNGAEVAQSSKKNPSGSLPWRLRLST